MTNALRRGLRWTDWLFAILMLALAGFCLFLGNWQMQRLHEKELLVAAVEARLDAPAEPLPQADTWSGLDLEALNFQPVTLAGTYDLTATVTVFTSLSDAKGEYGGPGYWVMTPFNLREGGTVFVNRGFIPQDLQPALAGGELGDVRAGTITLTGLLRQSEAAGFMTPEPDVTRRIEWVRDTTRLASLLPSGEQPVAPFYIDLPASSEGALPQGGETVLSFPNNHLSYAFTWYGFAVVAVVMLGFWLWRQSHARP